ncbi:MAG: AarF/ABC1/UbiB kinase family protein [Planctomycetes bacterium]|nr:AarF/ABC1/UbiB kinase family protein [Planctomycetota bacterium]
MFRSLKTLRSIPRLKDIAFVLGRHGFYQVAGSLQAPFTAQLRRIFKRKPRHVIQQPERLRMVLEDLGPTFIKFGQLLSTRPDLLPVSYLRELEKLQDEVQPEPFSEIRAVLDEEFRGEVDALFRRIDPEPLATASIAQAHRAVTRDGKDVVVKVRKRGLERIVEQDLVVLGLLVDFLRDWPGLRLFDPEGVLRVFERSIRCELNFDYERNNLLTLRRNLAEGSPVCVPRPIPECSTSAVLTMEYLAGEKLSSYAQRRMPREEGETYAENLAVLILRQIFEDGIFHADPHPGNVILMGNGRIGLIDVGNVGRVTPELMDELIVVLVALIRRDYRRLSRWILKQGQPAVSIDPRELAVELMDQLEPYYGLSLEEIRVGELFNALFGLIMRFEIRVPPQYVMVGRTLVTMEGSIRLCAPKMDVLRRVEPYVKDILRARWSATRIAREVESQLQDVLSAARSFPANCAEVLARAAEGRLRIESVHTDMDKIEKKLDAIGSRVSMALLIGALLVSSTALLCFGTEDRVGHLAWALGGTGLFAAFLLGVRLLLGR